MKYEFKSLKKAGPRLRKIFQSEVASAIQVLEAITPAKALSATHEARKHFKKIRALLRLGRAALGEDVFRQENACFRELGRQLSALRDAQVRVRTLDDLRLRVRKRESSVLLKKARKLLIAEEANTMRQWLQNAVVSEVVSQLRAAHVRSAEWLLQEFGPRQVLRALRRSYRRARESARAARSKPGAHRFHEFRKRVKDLWYHARLLYRSAPGFMEQLELELNAMAEALGHDHDLWVLGNTLKSHAKELEPPGALAAVRKLIDEERSEYSGVALESAARVLRLAPEGFVKQVLEARREHLQARESEVRAAELEVRI